MGGDYKVGDIFKIKSSTAGICRGAIKKQNGNLRLGWAVHPDELILFGEKTNVFDENVSHEVNVPW